ncbi:MAG: hypothetical protein CSA62_12015 [Planctomycetota bacterium]|nr:MAG: hypothetical protein CSA62_12015 [Planctomycetota bacterium]
MSQSRKQDLWHGYDAVRDRPRLRRFLVEALAYPQLVWQDRSLVRNFYRRELLGRFRGSIFGLLWVLIHPIFLFATYYLVFGVMFNQRAPNGLPEMWYPLYLFTGVIAWTAFAESTARCASLVVENGNLIKKVSFPAQLLPLHILGVNTLVYGIGVLCYLIVAVAMSFPLPGTAVIALPVVLFVQLLFTLGASLLLGAVHVFFRDVAQIWPILLNFWFFATPIFWYPGMIHDMDSLLPLLEWNPMYHVMLAHRWALGMPTVSGSFLGTGEVLGLAMTGLIPALITFFLGFVVFRSLQHRFADEV